MTLIIRNIGRFFQPNYKNLDAKFWVQKLILKKYLNSNKTYSTKSKEKRYLCRINLNNLFMEKLMLLMNPKEYIEFMEIIME